MADYDVLVIGAGILGLSTAHHIKTANPPLKMLVVDRNVAAGLGSTVNSAAAFRSFFSSKSNFELADSSIEFYRHLQEHAGVDLKMRWCGYLWCFTQQGYEQTLPALKELKAKGLIYKEYTPEELRDTIGMRVDFSWDVEAQKLGLGDVHRAVFVPKAGLIGVMLLVRFYESELLRMGAKIQYRTQVKRLLVEPKAPSGLPGEPYFWQDSAVVGAETDTGVLRATKTIVAAGAWSTQLLDPIGVECFVKARKRQVFNVKADTEPLKQLLQTSGFTDAKTLPFTILPKPAIYLRPNLDREAFGIGYADEFPRAYQIEDHPKPEPDFYALGLQPIVSKYLPQFEGAKSSGGFAGLYEINTLDEQPVVFGEHGLVVVGGASGSGIMKADSIGSIAAAAYAGEEFATLFGGRKFMVSDLGLKNRRVEHEKLVI